MEKAYLVSGKVKEKIDKSKNIEEEYEKEIDDETVKIEKGGQEAYEKMNILLSDVRSLHILLNLSALGGGHHIFVKTKKKAIICWVVITKNCTHTIFFFICWSEAGLPPVRLAFTRFWLIKKNYVQIGQPILEQVLIVVYLPCMS